MNDDTDSQQMFEYRVRSPTDGTLVHYLSLLSPEQVTKRGLRPETILGQNATDADKFIPQNFKQNRVFINFLHWVIAKHVGLCPDIIAEAKRLQNGHIYIIDLRTPTPSGNVPTEDVLVASPLR